GVHRVEQRLRRRADALFHPDESHETRHLDHSFGLRCSSLSHLRRTTATVFDIAIELPCAVRHPPTGRPMADTVASSRTDRKRPMVTKPRRWWRWSLAGLLDSRYDGSPAASQRARSTARCACPNPCPARSGWVASRLRNACGSS